MNKKQRENTSKLAYEIIKITFGGLIVSGFLSGKFSLTALMSGLVVCFVFYKIAYHLDGREELP